MRGLGPVQDLERPLCRGSYFVRDPSSRTLPKAPKGPLPSYKAVRSFHGLQPPRLQRSSAGPPSVMHFNGNGKRHLYRCVEEFRELRLLAGTGEERAECTFFDGDQNSWKRIR
eukprot:s2913_g9.t1